MLKIKVIALFFLKATLILWFSGNVIARSDANEILIPDFLPLDGEWSLHYRKYEYQKKESAHIRYVPDISLPNKDSCEGVLFSAISDDSILGVAHCNQSVYVICSGGFDKCVNGYQTKRKDNVLQYRSDFNGNRYRIEFFDNKIIQRIQEKTCLISYPHGCLINGFGWNDYITYEFIRSNNES